MMGGEFVNSVDVTEASVIIAGAEQSILVSMKRIEESVSGMRTASELILADLNRPMEEVAWDIPAIATQNETSKGKLQVPRIIPKQHSQDFLSQFHALGVCSLVEMMKRCFQGSSINNAHIHGIFLILDEFLGMYLIYIFSSIYWYLHYFFNLSFLF